MREFSIATAKREHPYAWIWEPLETEETFLLKSTFGGKSVYLDGKLLFYFNPNQEPWHGMLVCTDWIHHASLQEEFPELSQHPVLGKWLYISESSTAFERVTGRIILLARRRDPRIGVEPKPKKRKKAAR